MSIIRIFLGLSVIVWLPYGILCFLEPGYLQGAAGVAFAHATGKTELRAMYGGLQIAIGALALAGSLRPAYATWALRTLAVLCAGLGTARLLGLLLDGSATSYTVTALCFELGTVLVAFLLLRGGARSAAA